jgi:hypothetical protein
MVGFLAGDADGSNTEVRDKYRVQSEAPRKTSPGTKEEPGLRAVSLEALFQGSRFKVQGLGGSRFKGKGT